MTPMCAANSPSRTNRPSRSSATSPRSPIRCRAGAAIPFSFTASITGPDGLAVTAPGVYPLMVNVNGAVVLPDGPLEARIGELHLLLTVMGVPAPAPRRRRRVRCHQPVQTDPGTPLPVNFVWPVVDRPHLGVGGVFLNEDLLAAISPGGRLSTLVDGLLDPAAEALPAGALTVVLDPELLDELDRMTTRLPGGRRPGHPAAVARRHPAGRTDRGRCGAERRPPTATRHRRPLPGDAAESGFGEHSRNGRRNRSGGRRVLPRQAARCRRPLPGTAAALQRSRRGGHGPRRTRRGSEPAVQHGNDVAQRVLGSNPGGGTSVPPPATVMAYPINGAVDVDTLAALRSDGLGHCPAGRELGRPERFRGRRSPGQHPRRCDTRQLGKADAGRHRPTRCAERGRHAHRPGAAVRLRDAGECADRRAGPGLVGRRQHTGRLHPRPALVTRRTRAEGPHRFDVHPRRQPGDHRYRTRRSGQFRHGGRRFRTTRIRPASRNCPPTTWAGCAPIGRMSRAFGRPSPRRTRATDPALVLDPLDQALDSAGSTAFRDDPDGRHGQSGHRRSRPSPGSANGVEISLGRQFLHAGVIDLAVGADRAEQPARTTCRSGWRSPAASGSG